jgi:hypothetical protein
MFYITFIRVIIIIIKHKPMSQTTVIEKGQHPDTRPPTHFYHSKDWNWCGDKGF